MSVQQATRPAWSDTFAASYRDLLRFLRRRTGCAETARDLAQDAWLRIAEHDAANGVAANAPGTPDHARAYLFTVADRLAIDHMRRQRHWDSELAPRLLAGPHQSPDVAETHAYAQALRAVERALAEMPARMREVFVAHRLHGVPHSELALRFAVSRKTIEREVSQAMDLAQAALEQHSPPAVRRSTLPGVADLPPVRRGRRKAMVALLGLGGVGGATSIVWQVVRERLPDWQTALSVPPGKTSRLPLPDGSEAVLDADSAIEVRLFAAQRELRLLRGGAYLSVARDVQRPFVVLAGPARITVLGTRFAVDLGAQDVSVAVESGQVSVRGAAGAPVLVLGPGDTARVAEDGSPAQGPARSTEAVAPWRSGWLDFDRLPLVQAVERLNRYRPGAPVQVDPAVAALPVLARVNIARSTQWLQSLPSVLPVRVTLGTTGEVLVAPR
ncbi:sigma-70 family RNA polymerase sigma factor [Aquabacterium sp.]|uniref:sigma-70 family RNA polymerase sigma factor n=1 Tax=Aquabacterium sp. TaxID=1872578 RepID=UPI002CBE8095|nr:sigma-70 family RNA polymerase sigma factor [Aquabacterium sp.]HSW07624.1 sigma-70 family RNA polymerase sigma factor [Aquabacterium sp.]